MRQGRLATFGVIAKIAFRNLFASRLKTFIVGGIILFGALLVVVGSSFVDSIVAGMRRSIVGSVAGHIQVYSSKSRDPLEVMGGFSLEGPDLASLDDFAKVRQTLMSIPGVKSVVPIGVNGAIVPSGNTIDVALANLRELVRRKVEGSATPADLAAYEAKKDHVRQILSVLQGDMSSAHLLRDEKADSKEDAEAVARATSRPPGSTSTKIRSTRWSFSRIASRRRRPMRTCCSCATSAPIPTCSRSRSTA